MKAISPSDLIRLRRLVRRVRRHASQAAADAADARCRADSAAEWLRDLERDLARVGELLGDGRHPDDPPPLIEGGLIDPF